MMKVIRFFQASLRTRLILGIGAMLLPLLALAAGAFFYLQSAVASLDQVVADPVLEMQSIAHLQVLLLRTAKPINDHVFLMQKNVRSGFEGLNHKITSAFSDITTVSTLTPVERNFLESAAQEWQAARRIALDSLSVSHPKNVEAQKQRTEEFATRINRAIDDLDQTYRLVLEEVGEQLTAMRVVRHKLLLGILGLFFMAAVVAVIAGLLLARSILRPLRVLTQGAERFGKGDLSHRIALTNHDELGHLAVTFNSMAQNLGSQQAALAELSIRDGLTGLYNNREFRRRLQEEVERSHRYARGFSLLMLDFDHFKSINDTYGHPAGDHVLRKMAAEITAIMRPTDFVARYGGEEFAIILPETLEHGASVPAERIRAAVANCGMRVTEQDMIHVTVSVGLAGCPKDASSAEDLIAKADKALYDAKHSGRNRICWAR